MSSHSSKPVDLLIAVTGLTRTGKDTVAKLLSKKLHIPCLDNNKNVLWPILRKRKWKISKMNSVKLGGELRAKYGMNVMACLTLKLIRKRKLESVIVSGLRSWQDIAYYRKHCRQFCLIRVTAPLKARMERARKVKQKGETLTSSKDLKTKDYVDLVHKGFSRTLKLADFTIHNNSSLHNLNVQIDRLILTHFVRKI